MRADTTEIKLNGTTHEEIKTFLSEILLSNLNNESDLNRLKSQVSNRDIKIFARVNDIESISAEIVSFSAEKICFSNISFRAHVDYLTQREQETNSPFDLLVSELVYFFKTGDINLTVN